MKFKMKPHHYAKRKARFLNEWGKIGYLLFCPRYKTPTSKAASDSPKQSFALQAFYTLLVFDLDFPPTKASKYPSLIFFILPPGLLLQYDHPYTISSHF